MSHGMIRFIATLFLACLSLMAQGVEEVIYYHNDALGSPIIATDQEGRVVWRKSYTPYGQPIGQTAPNEPGYTGKFEEPDLGIQNFGARWYDPRIGRFLATDPAGFDPQNPQSFNRYAYANNNPYKYVDPDGRVPLDTIWDFGNIVYDVVNGNWGDAASDAGAMLIPFVPAGISKLRHVDDAIDVNKAGGSARGAASQAGSRESIVIGEDMAGRVIPTAKARGAAAYDPPSAPSETWMGNNRNWINQKMEEGCRILDCGAAPGRANYPEATSPYYRMELDEIEKRNYSNHEHIDVEGQ